MADGSGYGASQFEKTLLICNILRVFFGDRLSLVHTTSCKINAIHKMIVIIFFYYIRPPHQVFFHTRHVLLVSLICNMPMLLSPYQLKLSPSPETSTLKKEPNQHISMNHCIYHPYTSFHSQLTVNIKLFPNMSMPSLADLAKLKKLVNTFLWTPQIRL